MTLSGLSIILVTLTLDSVYVEKVSLASTVISVSLIIMAFQLRAARNVNVMKLDQWISSAIHQGSVQYVTDLLWDFLCQIGYLYQNESLNNFFCSVQQMLKDADVTVVKKISMTVLMAVWTAQPVTILWKMQ